MLSGVFGPENISKKMQFWSTAEDSLRSAACAEQKPVGYSASSPVGNDEVTPPPFALGFQGACDFPVRLLCVGPCKHFFSSHKVWKRIATFLCLYI